MMDVKDDEKELAALFGEEENDSNKANAFQKTVKKAKRRAVMRTVLISSLVSVLVAGVLSIGWLSIMRINEAKAIRDVHLFSQITDPNVHDAGYQHAGNGLFEGILYFNTYKMIDGVPVDWSDDIFTYSLFGGVSRFTGDHSPIQVTDQGDGQIRAYDRDSKERMMEFYHPEVEYEFLRNDLAQLESMPEDKVMEVAVSFDRSYSPKEVRDFLPDTLSLEWYWADTYSSLDTLQAVQAEGEGGTKPVFPAQPELAGQVYGFDEIEGGKRTSEEFFVDILKDGAAIKDGKYYGEFKRILDYVSGEAGNVDPEKVKVLGVVVTGSSSELEELQGMTQVRASVFGVIVD
jgi:hypothetical protein